jgi:hypothetical protein
MKHVLFATVAAFGLMAGAAMAQDVGYDVTAPRPPIPGPVMPAWPTVSPSPVPSNRPIAPVSARLKAAPTNFATTAAQSPRKPVPEDKHTG